MMSQTPAKTCPQCGKPSVHDYRPFCSARCQQVDLGKWVSGHYVIAGQDGNALDENGELPPVKEE